MLNQKSEQKNDLKKKIAWNAISFQVPSAWEIDSLDATHIIIGDDGTPELEIKWTDSPTQFTLEKYLKKFIVQSQRTLNININELPAPKSFFCPDQNFEFFFFSWTSASAKGNGTLIFCSLCKRLTMLRFFSDSTISLNSLKALILSSFSDHPAGDEIHWHVFGMQFSTPARFKLIEYSFKPGCYIINFKHKKTILTLFSWGPARFLLENKDLTEFAKIRLPQLQGFAKTGTCRFGSYLEWSYNHGLFKNAQIIPLINRYNYYSLFRISNNRQNNRILGIMIDGPQKKDNYDIIERSIIYDIQEKKHSI
ncbi:MAG: hypothetical protein GY857_16850 [Desulfobacula sp.]|nr:hypothetical protein [Desulfobacula sp.]